MRNKICWLISQLMAVFCLSASAQAQSHTPNTTSLTTSPPISTTVLPAPDIIFTRHHLQLNAGVGFRF